MPRKNSEFASPRRIMSKLKRDLFIETEGGEGQNKFSSSHLRLPNMGIFL